MHLHWMDKEMWHSPTQVANIRFIANIRLFTEVASCQVWCLAFEEELTVPLKYLSLFITHVKTLLGCSLLKPDLRVSPLVFRVSGNLPLRRECSIGFFTHLGHEILDGDVVVHLLLTC